MNKTQAIEVLSSRYGAEYKGTYTVPACSGDLIQDIMNEGSEGKTYHKWATLPMMTMVSEEHLIGLAKNYV